MALRFFALYVVSLVVGLLMWAGVLGIGFTLILVAVAGLGMVAARVSRRRAQCTASDDA